MNFERLELKATVAALARSAVTTLISCRDQDELSGQEYGLLGR